MFNDQKDLIHGLSAISLWPSTGGRWTEKYHILAEYIAYIGEWRIKIGHYKKLKPPLFVDKNRILAREGFGIVVGVVGDGSMSGL